MDLDGLIERGAVALRGVTGKPQALSALADMAARRVGAPASEVLQALSARERVGSTGVGGGVALPHARIPALKTMQGVFLRLEQPVPYDAVDGRPVDLLFALFAPMDAGAEHLQALARVSRVLRDNDLRRQLRSARSADAIYALLTREAQPSAA